MNPTLAGIALNTVNTGLWVIIAYRAYRANVGHTRGEKKERTRRKGYSDQIEGTNKPEERRKCLTVD